MLSVYRPPGGNLELFGNTLSYVLDYCLTGSKSIFVCGDLNINYFDSRSTLEHLMISFDLVVTSTEATRVFTNRHGVTSSTKIDYILTNVNTDLVCSRVVDPNIGDHKALVLIYDGDDGPPPVRSIPRFFRDVSGDNLESLSLLTTGNVFDTIYSITDVDKAFESFFKTLTSLLDSTCPIKRTRSAEHQRPGWISKDIRRASDELKNLHWVCQNLKTEESRNRYSIAKKQYSRNLKSAKYNFFVAALEQSPNKNKTIWDLVRGEMGGASSDRVCLNVDNRVISDPEEVAEIFGKYFSSIASSSIADHYGDRKSSSCTTQQLTDNNFFFLPVVAHEVLSVIKNLRNGKSCGKDMISVKILKAIAHSISNCLAHLVNISVTSGRFPPILKIAKVIPVHKKKNATGDLTNYRPISILSSISKVMEKLVYDRMLSYLNKFSSITDCQHGFRAGRSTETAAYQFAEFVYTSLDDGVYVAGLFFDLSRAFDCLNINFILEKLYNLGFRGVFLDWIRSFLVDRHIFVRVGQRDSDEYPLEMGVPQGSVLGPLLFLLFINDLPDYIRNFIVIFISNILMIMFADDVSFMVTASSLTELKSRCELLAEFFSDWCYKNVLILNVNKTDLIHFRVRDNSERLVLNLTHGRLESSDGVRFLGLHVDGSLTWQNHTEFVCKRLSSAFYALKRLRTSFPLQSIVGMYYSLAYSHMSYNTMLWGASSGSSCVFVAQKRIIRLMFGLKPQESCKPVFISHNILCFPCIYILNCLLFTKKNIHTHKKCSQFHEYDTRHKEIISIPAHRTAKFEQSPIFSGIKLYNHLPNRLKMLEFLAFKKEIKKILLEKCFYSKTEYLEAALV